MRGEHGVSWCVFRLGRRVGLPARIAQHEVDHLDGVLILDRTDPDSRRRALATLRPTPRL